MVRQWTILLLLTFALQKRKKSKQTRRTIAAHAQAYGVRVVQLLTTVHQPTTVGSRSINTARGTCFPAPVSLKKVLKESSPPPMVLSEGPSARLAVCHAPDSRAPNKHCRSAPQLAQLTWTELDTLTLRERKRQLVNIAKGHNV